ncbi:4-hydroxythreonine-4-phosphate dehydrogenase PdxA [Microvirga lotononidis]|uniref:4-hydroxythreonine-4-phosphate dehydrogenase n=1 Tax=Microvirga lotononidis TaxID=864069 RepID=I4YWI0_9HYPH|nr:4-hydroxythreonine-4-phosphate dehydrogenase PdxA [Microvirga lotononidis]EIM28322.1 4-hydroxythreonine-4-phosphate dehydrogenase [Microvirga lotononidis]WQO27586.1 4-hydroxythreonine-4-phosphate dehydrogenase PdxA [Microvirga lotononidis]
MGLQQRPSLLLTQGDPAGIGPELSLRAWLERDAASLPAFGVVGDPGHLDRVAKRYGWDVPIVAVEPDQIRAAFSHALPVVPLSAPVSAEPGKPDPAHAASVIESIGTAVRLVRAGSAAAVVTNPIAKHVLYEAGFRHPGHTEFLAALAAEGGPETYHPVMMLWSEPLAVVPVTVHIPLADVPAALTTDLIVLTGRIVARELRQRFGVENPRLALAGLNPHAGESGAMGTEDESVIVPAADILRSEGIDVTGPLSADTMFHARARSRYDAALAMYHDQALIPIKTIAFDEAVNVTLGLPFVRTSPDHGTAFDIAGKGIARPDSLMAALKLAARLTSP